MGIFSNFSKAFGEKKNIAKQKLEQGRKYAALKRKEADAEIAEARRIKGEGKALEL